MISRDGKNVAPMTSGRAFCFLPLPVGTEMPVHINSYFELSSNRRDLWFGDDMAGVGKVKSQWNALLLSDVVGPTYTMLVRSLQAELLISSSRY